MKRIGFVYDEMVQREYCDRMILEAIRNKRKTPYIEHVRENYKDYGAKLQQTLINGWKPSPIREKTINEGTGRKKRELKIPTLPDHFVHTAVAKILEKYLPKRFYFYACGSLPNRGQTFAVKAVEGHVRKRNPKHCALADVKKCYKSIKKRTVMRCLRRVFKDEKFLKLNEQILDQMGDGLAIGFTVSHWYAHLVLSFIDIPLKEAFPDVFFVRYMDNFVMLCNRKRTLHKVLKFLSGKLAEFDLRLKEDWQVFPIRCRMIEFLSYRIDHCKTILRKALMYRMSSRFRKAKTSMNVHTARTVMSYFGVLKHCDSHNFKESYLYPNVSIKVCRRLISDADKERALFRAAKPLRDSIKWAESVCGVSS